MTDKTYLNVTDMYEKISKYSAIKLYEKFNKKNELWIQTLGIINEYILYLNKMEISPKRDVLLYLKNINSGKIKYIIEIGNELFENKCDIEKNIIYMYDFKNSISRDNGYPTVNIHYPKKAIMDNIIQTNPENISIKNNFIDVYIIYFRLWGNAIDNYIKEAHRILERYGILIIVDIDVSLKKIKEYIYDKFIIIKLTNEPYLFIEAIKK